MSVSVGCVIGELYELSLTTSYPNCLFCVLDEQEFGLPSLGAVRFQLECLDGVYRFMERFGCRHVEGGGSGCRGIRTVVSMAMGVLQGALVTDTKVSKGSSEDPNSSLLFFFIEEADCGGFKLLCGCGFTAPVGVCLHETPPPSTAYRRRHLPIPRDGTLSHEVRPGQGEGAPRPWRRYCC